jgi:REP element-mobilizing transposase RayT
MAIYLDDRDHLTFLDRLDEVVEDCHLVCFAYCLMANHYHLVIRTLDANISRAMQRLNGRYAQWWNHRHQRTGHVFQGRFGAQVIADDAYLLTACRYVVLNPVRAGLVPSPGDWRWSSYLATAALAPVPGFLNPHEVWGRFSDGATTTAVEHYRRFVADVSAQSLSSSPVVGSVAVAAGPETTRAQASPGAREKRRERPPLGGLFAGAMTYAARSACAGTAHRAGYSMAEIARFLAVHPTTVSKMIANHQTRGATS